MELLEMMKTRRSIRKYTDRKVEKEKLEKIVEAGLYAPNPGGRQGTKILMLNGKETIEKLGIVNANMENRNWGGMGVSKDQPSIIDDLSIRSGFYGCPALGIVCIKSAGKQHVNMIGSAFVCAQNMVMEAYDLGVSSCIVGRGEASFAQPEFKEIWNGFGIDEEYMPLVFVCLGYIDGEYPKIKARSEDRAVYIEAE